MDFEYFVYVELYVLFIQIVWFVLRFAYAGCGSALLYLDVYSFVMLCSEFYVC